MPGRQPLTQGFWQQEAIFLQATLLPFEQEAASLGVSLMEQDLAQIGLGFDNLVANQAAASWARQHTDSLLEMLGTTTRRYVGNQVASYITTPGQTIGDLTTNIERVLGMNHSRALMIARTETTRATAAGRNEGRVAAGLPTTVMAPPLHPRCRGGDSQELLDDGTWVVTWLTRRDEVVCRQKYQTPLGEVEGCRAMHGRIISEGKYLGWQITDARKAATAAAAQKEQVTAEQAKERLRAALAAYEGGRRKAYIEDLAFEGVIFAKLLKGEGDGRFN